jgi:predicted lipoprotein with Yx(FWY)xxD motif
MTRNKLIPVLAGAALASLTALGVAAAGSDAATDGLAKAHHSQTTVDVRSTGLGKILVNSKGHTLYTFKKDKGTKSACTGACAKAWPPLRASGKPRAGSGTSASRVGTTKRPDGKPQVTYNGHPLYTFVKDTKAGQTNGQGLTAFGGSWFAVSPAGNQVSGKPSNPGGGGGTGGY